MGRQTTNKATSERVISDNNKCNEQKQGKVRDWEVAEGTETIFSEVFWKGLAEMVTIEQRPELSKGISYGKS